MNNDVNGQLTMLPQEDYKEFTQKFETKLTTDDCYTPEAVYNAVAGYVENRYGVPREFFVRPFFPNHDFITTEYACGEIVVDNPPFSILKDIVEFYNKRKIGFFLFAPALVIPGGRATKKNADRDSCGHYVRKRSCNKNEFYYKYGAGDCYAYRSGAAKNAARPAEC